MKNVIKKIASIAMTFTLLGTGTALTQTISPKSDYIITADAAQLCKKLASNDPRLIYRVDYDPDYKYYRVEVQQGVDIRKSPSISAPIMMHCGEGSALPVTGRELHRHKTYKDEKKNREGLYTNEIWVQARNGGWFPIQLDVYYKKPKNWHEFESQP